MKINKTTRYALIAVGYIAQHYKQGPVQTQRISDEYGISGVYLQKILQQLATVNVLRSKKGPGGGFSLARDATKITLLDIIEAIDGPMLGSMYLAEQTKNEGFSVRMEKLCHQAIGKAKSVLGKVTLAEIIKLGKQK